MKLSERQQHMLVFIQDYYQGTKSKSASSDCASTWPLAAGMCWDRHRASWKEFPRKTSWPWSRPSTATVATVASDL